MSTTRGPSKINGQYHTVKGALRETFGRALGLSGVKARGKIERTRGKTEYNAARATGYANGTGNRVGGGADRVVGAITGNSSQEMGGKIKNERGAIGQAINRH